MTQIPLNVICEDGTQIRAAINDHVVAEYADRMNDGVEFPPVVLFFDGETYHLADGFHRCRAGQRVGATHIQADVRDGTQTDALWFALGANKANGYRLTTADKKHAILLAFKTWPERSSRELAEQIGCNQDYVSELRRKLKDTLQLPDYVVGRDGKRQPATRQPSTQPPSPRDGRKLDRSRQATDQRREQMRELAAQGQSSRQIAATVGLSEAGCRNTLREQGIEVPADRVLGKLRRHKASRIVESMVMDAENLTADVELIVFEELDPTRLAEWVRSLTASRNKLGEFIRRLMKEKQKHGEAA